MGYEDRRKQEQEDLENYLKDVHYDRYPALLDDEIPDHYDNWISQLTLVDIKNYAKKMCLIPHTRIAEEYAAANF